MKMTPYQRRKRADALANLERAGVIEETEENDKPEPLALAEAKGRIVIPAHFSYSSLSLVALKTALACHQSVRYSRTPFQFTATQSALAEKAGIAERRVGGALAELQRRRFLVAQKVWRTGTKITLYEPSAGGPLFYLGQYHMKRLDAVLIPDRYIYLLGDRDPKQKLKNCTGPLRNYRVICPFCHCFKDREPTFTFTSEEDCDRWRCHHCKRGGDSRRLWALCSNWKADTDWRTIITDVCGPPPVLNHSAFDCADDLVQDGALTP